MSRCCQWRFLYGLCRVGNLVAASSRKSTAFFLYPPIISRKCLEDLGLVKVCHKLLHSTDPPVSCPGITSQALP